MKALLAITALVFFSGCASTEFKTYEGRTTIFEGEGGTKTTVDGIDFWENGAPPRRYQLLGIIEDSRPQGLIPMARMKTDIAKTAKAQNADAVIIISSASVLRGVVNNSSASAQVYGNSATAQGTSVATPVFTNQAKFAVVRYLDKP